MNWEIKKDKNLLTVAIEGRFVAAVAPDLREEVGAKITDGTNVLCTSTQADWACSCRSSRR